MDEVVEPHGEGTVIKVWAVPGARSTTIVGSHGGRLKVRVAAPADRGAANRAVADHLGAVLGVRGVVLVGPATRREKRFLVPGRSPAGVAAALRSAAAGE